MLRILNRTALTFTSTVFTMTLFTMPAVADNAFAFTQAAVQDTTQEAAQSIGPLTKLQNPHSLSSELRPFSANFLAYRSGSDVGTAIITLEPIADNRYELSYESDLSRFFFSDKRVENTIFSYICGQLIPHQYDYKRTGTGSDKSLSLTFNQATKEIQKGDGTIMPWSGELDNQLFRVDFPYQLAKGATTTHYDFINYRGQKRDYTLEVLSTDNLTLPYGNITAIKVLVGRESSRRTTYAWFAPSLNYNLVRLQQYKDDKEQADIQLNTFIYL